MSDKQKALSALLYPAIYVSVLWLIKIAEELLHTSFHSYGVLPLNITGLRGIIFSPFIHGSYQHLLSNTFPLLVLGWALFYFYRELGLRITLLSWVMSGLWVWVFARESYHIGASGIIYSWAAFLFVSGVIRNHPRLMALSLLVAFLYGSMVWGIFPLRQGVSWEGHLMGMLAGMVLALFYKETGPKRKLYSWELEEEEDDPIEQGANPYWMVAHYTENITDHTGKRQQKNNEKDNSLQQEEKKDDNISINYIYVPKKEDKDSGKDKNN